jgi:hypothetical protein
VKGKAIKPSPLRTIIGDYIMPSILIAWDSEGKPYIIIETDEGKAILKGEHMDGIMATLTAMHDYIKR